MGHNTSIYLDQATAERARWMAKAENRSFSNFVAELINERFDQCFPRPPILAVCPTCKQQAELTYFAVWPEMHTDLYVCSACRTTISGLTLQDQGILDPDGNIVPRETEGVTFSPQDEVETCTA